LELRKEACKLWPLFFKLIFHFFCNYFFETGEPIFQVAIAVLTILTSQNNERDESGFGNYSLVDSFCTVHQEHPFLW